MINSLICRHKTRHIKILLAYCLLIPFLFVQCDKDEVETKHITDIKVNEMAELCLPGFELTREGTDSLETRYVFYRNSDSTFIYLTTGIYTTSEEAISLINTMLSFEAVLTIEGKYQETLIGEKLWWSEWNSDPSELTRIIFVRYNSFVILYSHNYDILTLAQQIDDDILNEVSYFTFEE